MQSIWLVCTLQVPTAVIVAWIVGLLQTLWLSCKLRVTVIVLQLGCPVVALLQSSWLMGLWLHMPKIILARP